MCVEVSPKLLVQCPPPLSNLLSMSLFWSLCVAFNLYYTDFSLESVLGEWVCVCACMCMNLGAAVCVSLCLIEGAVTPRGWGPYFIVCNHESVVLKVGANKYHWNWIVTKIEQQFQGSWQEPYSRDRTQAMAHILLAMAADCLVSPRIQQ